MSYSLKKSFVLLNTSLVIIFILLLVATYTRYTTMVTSMEFHKDLAKIRGYWGAYGAKELENNIIYIYYDSNLKNKIYEINATYYFESTGFPFYGKKNIKSYWNIIDTPNTIIKDNLINKRELRIDNDIVGRYDVNKTMSYIK
jgi:hypothetical protein